MPVLAKNICFEGLNTINKLKSFETIFNGYYVVKVSIHVVTRKKCLILPFLEHMPIRTYYKRRLQHYRRKFIINFNDEKASKIKSLTRIFIVWFLCVKKLNKAFYPLTLSLNKIKRQLKLFMYDYYSQYK